MKNYFKAVRINLVIGFLFYFLIGNSQDPGPITTAGTASVCAGTTFSIPVTVVDFFNVGIISLKINYDAAKVQYQSVTVNPDLNILNPLYSGTATQFSLSGFGSTGVTLDDNTILFTMTFLAKTGVSGITTFAWNSSPGSCEYAPPAPDPPYLTLPFGNFFINGSCNINATPIPVITGPSSVCINSTGNIYSTETGMTNYLWTVSSGGTIQSGGGPTDPTVTVTWNVSGNQSVSVGYTTSAGCTSASPTMYSVIVNPLPDTPGAVTGNTSVCGGASGVVYAVNPVTNATSYNWTVPVGASVVSGGTTNSITVNYATNASSGFISVSGVNSCGTGASSPLLPVAVTILPSNAGSISGAGLVCQGENNVTYSVATIANATGYLWTLPNGAVIASGGNTNSILVNFSSTASSGIITVNGTNGCGNGTVSPDFPVQVSPAPDPPVISVINHTTLRSNVADGNQWYRDGILLTGQTGQDCIPTLDGSYWDVVTVNNCPSDTSNHIEWPEVGTDDLDLNSFLVYPVPTTGIFTIEMERSKYMTYQIDLFDILGERVFHQETIPFSGNPAITVDLKQMPVGIYTGYVSNDHSRRIFKIIVSR